MSSGSWDVWFDCKVRFDIIFFLHCWVSLFRLRLQPSVSHADSGSQNFEPSVPFCDISQVGFRFCASRTCISTIVCILLNRADAWWCNRRRRRLLRAPDSRFLVPISRRTNQAFQPSGVGELVPFLSEKDKDLHRLSTSVCKSLNRPNTHSNCFSAISGSIAFDRETAPTISCRSVMECVPYPVKTLTDADLYPFILLLISNKVSPGLGIPK